MDIQINWLGVVLAAASALGVGMVWYSGALFGKEWTRVTGVTEKDMKKAMPQAMPQIIVAALLTAYVLAHVTYLSQSFFHESYMKAALTSAFWIWLGISATTLVAHDAFENRSKKLLAINVGNRLATYMVMALIIGAIGL